MVNKNKFKKEKNLEVFCYKTSKEESNYDWFAEKASEGRTSENNH